MRQDKITEDIKRKREQSDKSKQSKKLKK